MVSKIRNAFRKAFRAFTHFIRGLLLKNELALPPEVSTVRSEAEEAVARVVFETDIAPDCVSAGELRGGCAIFIEHMVRGKKNTTAFVHKSYENAVTEAIAWIRSDAPATGSRSKMNRHQRRVFQSKKRKAS